jgi:hypothetical protein
MCRPFPEPVDFDGNEAGISGGDPVLSCAFITFGDYVTIWRNDFMVNKYNL